MVIVGVALYLGAVALGLALLCLPAWRERMLLALRGSARAARSAAGDGWRRGGGSVQRIAQPLRLAGHDLGEGWRRHRRLLTAGLALLLLAPGAALLLRQWNAYDGFDHTYSREANAQIAELLRGEQLVPPPALPPELFTTREVEQARPLAASASRQWELLDAEFRQRLLLAFRLMREQNGVEMVLIEGYRSPERQAQLAGMGERVTHAGAGQSYHQYGLAADCAFLRNGRIVISEREEWAERAYAQFGAAAQSVGLGWGGAWRSLRDLGHVELARPGVLPARAAAASAG